jgi:hypothetical protein
MVIKSDVEVTSILEKKERKPVVAMVPLFSLRTLKAVAIGVVVGVVLGLGFAILSPMLSPTGGKTWQSDIEIQLVNPGSSYLPLRDLGNIGMNYFAKASSYPFLEFLSQDLAEQAPQYSHTSQELYKMITVRYDNLSTTPVFHVTVATPTLEETTFLITQIPKSFKSYLINEDNNSLQQQNQAIQKAIDNVKTAILETEQEMSALAPTGAAGDVQNDPKYIALDANVRALELELNSQASGLSALIASGDVSEYANMRQQDYEKILQQVKTVTTDILKAQQELKTLEEKRIDISNNPSYVILDSKINALQTEIDRRMTGYTEVTSGGDTTYVLGLAEMITNGITTSSDYTSMLQKIGTASAALVEARKELAILEKQANDNSPTETPEYQLAQANVETLNTELSALRERLTLLTRESLTAESQPDPQAAFDRTSTALAEARTELAVLKAQAGNKRLAENLDYQLNQGKIENLNAQLATLNQRLNSSLASYNDPAQAANYLTLGNPSIPEPVLPITLRDALLLGAVIGVGGAWVVLNFKWLIKGTPSTQKEEEDEAWKR